MSRDSIWISLRLHRFELITLGLTALAAIGAALWVSLSLDGLRLSHNCLIDPAAVSFGGSFSGSFAGPFGGPQDPLCDKVLQDFNNISYSQGSVVSLFLNMLPVVAGLILGASVVGREVERGTTRLAWSLTPARLPWFVARAIPILVVLTIVSIAIGLAADRLTMARNPGLDIGSAFLQNGERGLPVAGRAVAAYGLAVMTGAVLGRELPGLVFALIGLIAVLIGTAKLDDAFLRTETIARDSTGQYAGDLYMDQKFRMPDGRVLSWDEAFPQGRSIDEQGNPVDEQGNPVAPSELPTQIDIVVPGERYGFASARNAGEFALVGIAGLVLAAGAAARRGPGT